MHGVELLTRVVLVVVLCALGYVLRKRFDLDKLFECLTKVLFYFSIPITIFFSTLDAPRISALMQGVAAAFIHMTVLTIILFSIASRLRGSWIDVAVLASLPNSLFLPTPLSEIVLGSALPILPHAVAFNAVLVVVLAILSMMLRESMGVKLVARVVPYATSFAVALALRIYEPVLCSSLSQSLSPLATATNIINLTAFLIVGSEMSFVKSFSIRREVIYVAIARYVASPAILLTTILLIPGLSNDMVLGMVIQSVMPPAVTCIIVSRMYNLDTELTTLSIAFLTPVSTAIALAIPTLAKVLGLHR